MASGRGPPEEEGEKIMKIWSCKIGETEEEGLPPGADLPMSEAVNKAYVEITGKEPKFCFSGWGAELDKIEREIVEEKRKLP